jgi:hypothetical protein
MSEQYQPNSVNAVLSRIETKLDTHLGNQERINEEHGAAIQKLWKALGRLDVRVAGIAGGVSALAAVIKYLWR